VCAIKVVRIGDTGYLRALKYFSVPRADSGEVPKSPSPQELVNVHLGRKTVLPSELENKLVEYCIIMDQSYYGLRCQDIKPMAFQLTIRNALKHPFNKKLENLGRNSFNPFYKVIQYTYENSCRHFSSSGERFYVRKHSKVFLTTMNLN
jgi:hypothetical protein